MHNAGSDRFEADVAGHRAVLQYYLESNSIVFTHTEVAPQIEGQGVGGALAQAGLDYARRESLMVVPLCPFVQEYIRRHPKEGELVKPKCRKN